MRFRRAAQKAPAGGGVLVNTGGTFNMYGGTIKGCKNVGVLVAKKTKGFGTFNMYGGVYVKGGSTFIMNGGEIIGNVATNKGGGVYVERNSKFELSGGVTIADNAVTTGTDLRPENVCLGKDVRITVTAEPHDTLHDRGHNGRRDLHRHPHPDDLRKGRPERRNRSHRHERHL